MSYPLTLQAAQRLRTLDQLSKYRKKAQSVAQEIVLDHPQDPLWSLLCHTDLLNQQVGMKATTNFFMPLAHGGSLMHAQAQNGPFKLAYEEFSYIWEAPSVYAVERVFVKGPMKYLQFKVELQPLSSGTQTRVICSIYFVSKIPSALAKVIIGQEIRKFIDSFRRLAQRLDAGEKGLLPFFASLPEAAFAPLTEKWSPFTSVAGLARDLAHYFLCAPERLSYRLRPREFAAWYDHDPLDVLNLCLYLAYQKELCMHWDCRCPGCKGPKESYVKLAALKNMGYCESCAAQYGVAFDQNIELTFSPAPHIRAVSDAFFCAGSPGNTPHIAWQQMVPAQTKAELHLQAPPGSYVLRSLSFKEEQSLVLDPAAPRVSLQLSLTEQGLEGVSETSVTGTACALMFDNTRDYDVTLVLEDIFWDDMAVTAAQVQCVQMFHDVFPAEGLEPGVVLPLSYQVFMTVHWEHSDEELWTWSQYQLGQFQGAMLQASTSQQRCWIFASTFDALAAAWSLQDAFNEMAGFYPETQALTVTLSAGPCHVQSNEKKLDYTGPALDAFERINSLYRTLSGHNILVPADWFAHPEMALFLTQAENNEQVSTYRLSVLEAPWVQFQWEASHGF